MPIQTDHILSGVNLEFQVLRLTHSKLRKCADLVKMETKMETINIRDKLAAMLPPARFHELQKIRIVCLLLQRYKDTRLRIQLEATSTGKHDMKKKREGKLQ